MAGPLLPGFAVEDSRFNMNCNGVRVYKCLQLAVSRSRCSRRTDARGCSTATGLAVVATHDVHAIESPTQHFDPPPPFRVQHELGTGRFALFGSGPSQESIICFCDADLNLKVASSPVLFSVLIAKNKGGCVDITARANAGLLVIDGLAFHDNPNDVLESSPEAHEARSSVYRGPMLNQRHLAEYLCHTPPLTPVVPTRQHHEFYYHAIRGRETRFNHFGHMPINTVNPRLYNALHEYLGELGVDDCLAEFVERYARKHAWPEEISNWRSQLLRQLKGAK